MRLNIDGRWTPRQAMRVLDCLTALHDAIWAAHEDALVDLIRRDLRAEEHEVQPPRCAPPIVAPPQQLPANFPADALPF